MIPLLAWLQHYGIVGMVMVFLLIFAATYWPGARARVERHGSIPLDDDC